MSVENPADEMGCRARIGAVRIMSATLSRDLRSEIERRFCESVGADSRDSRSRDRRDGVSARDLRNFFFMARRAFRAAILRRAGTGENAVKVLSARTHAIFCALKKCPFYRRFRNCAIDARRAVATRAMCSTQVAYETRRDALFAREMASRTRFVKAEAVFFVVL
jgi:hypothetical protein